LEVNEEIAGKQVSHTFSLCGLFCVKQRVEACKMHKWECK